MTPSGWTEAVIGEIAELVNGRGFKPHEWKKSGLPIIRIQNLNGGGEFNYYDGEYDPKIEVHTNDLLYAWSGSRGSSFGPHIWKGPKGVLNYHTWKVRPREQLVDKHFLLYLLKQITTKIENDAHGASALVHMQKWAMEEYKVQFPTNLSEQEKIAKILSTWDEALERLEKLTKQKEFQKKSFEKIYFFNQAPSKTIPLGDLFERVNRKNSNLESENVLTISAQHGLINQREFFKKSVASKNTENYYLLKKGDFAYNKSYSAGYPLGAIKPLESYEHGIVSPLYICFCLKKSSRSRISFYKHFFESGAFDLQIASIAQEGARNHGLLNVSVVDFFNLQIPDYSATQIDRVSSFFDFVDKELQLYRRKLSGLKLQKNGLMQQLLTGKRRVKV